MHEGADVRPAAAAILIDVRRVVVIQESGERARQPVGVIRRRSLIVQVAFVEIIVRLGHIVADFIEIAPQHVFAERDVIGIVCRKRRGKSVRRGSTACAVCARNGGVYVVAERREVLFDITAQPFRVFGRVRPAVIVFVRVFHIVVVAFGRRQFVVCRDKVDENLRRLVRILLLVVGIYGVILRFQPRYLGLQREIFVVHRLVPLHYELFFLLAPAAEKSVGVAALQHVVQQLVVQARGLGIRVACPGEFVPPRLGVLGVLDVYVLIIPDQRVQVPHGGVARVYERDIIAVHEAVCLLESGFERFVVDPLVFYVVVIERVPSVSAAAAARYEQRGHQKGRGQRERHRSFHGGFFHGFSPYSLKAFNYNILGRY